MEYVWNVFSVTYCLSVSQSQSVLMDLDLRMDSVSNPGVWQGLGAISQWFGTAGRNQFSQMRCWVLVWFFFCEGVVCLFFKSRMRGGPPRGQLAPLIKCYIWERIGDQKQETRLQELEKKPSRKQAVCKMWGVFFSPSHLAQSISEWRNRSNMCIFFLPIAAE